MNHWDQRSSLDRLPDSRSEPDLDRLWPGARLLLVDADGSVAVSADGQPLGEPARDARRVDDILVGACRGEVWFVRLVPALPTGHGASWRELPTDWQQLTAAAVALSRWAAAAPTCEACGAPTTPDAGGVRRRCPGCGALLFPRQDPAIIVAVVDPAERLLLARQASWPTGRFSLLAGFVEPGESLEQAVWREVAEEVGLDLAAVRYVSSQPWPLPRSLMFGFSARALEVSLVPDGLEIEQAEFVERRQLLERMERGQLSLPSSSSIARHLIEAWVAGALPLP